MAEERLQAFYEAVSDALEIMWEDADRDHIANDIRETRHAGGSARRAMLWMQFRLLSELLADIDDPLPPSGEAH